MMASNNWRKFRLNMWKNWLVEYRNKCAFIQILCFPIFMSLILFIMRCATIYNRYNGAVYYDSEPLDKLSSLRSMTKIKFTLAYYPTNTFTDEIMSLVAQDLELISMPVGTANIKELEDRVMNDSLIAGVMFDIETSSTGKPPMNFSYKLRFPGQLRFTSPQEHIDIWPVNRIFPLDVSSTPRNLHDNDGGPPGAYIKEGFATLQNALFKSYMNIVGKKTFSNISLERMPYSKYVSHRLLDPHSAVFISLIIFISFTVPTSHLIRNLTIEKEKGHREILKIMGLNNWIQLTCWFLKSAIFLIVSSTIITITLKLILSRSDWFIIWFFFLIYSISATAFCIMVSTFFSKANTAYTIGSLLFAATFIPVLVMGTKYGSFDNTAHKVALSFFMNTALGFGLHSMIFFERMEENLKWGSLSQPPAMSNDLSLGFYMIIMLVDAVIYMLIASYCSRVFPKKFGAQEPWNFLFKKSFWVIEMDGSGKNSEGTQPIQLDNRYFESDPIGKYLGVKILNLTKVYSNEKMAANNISFNLYEDQITVLLGHNGSGKSTIISLLTGLFRPTSGTALINGSDIQKNIQGARMLMGICPQHNILFNELTVEDHLRFYCALKGLDNINTKVNIDKYLDALQLREKRKEFPRHLSGGMQRKLCLALALCGNSKVVFCDEPTLGMDLASRRLVWDLLQKEKKGRTILLSTHYMDEADILGDRIAIIANGELKACGSPFFLRKNFGLGYRLICEKAADCSVLYVTKLLQKYIPNTVVENDVGSELIYKLPEEHIAVFEQILVDLEENCERLRINGFGISPTSLEEVFLRLTNITMSNNMNEMCDENYDTESANLTSRDFGVANPIFANSFNLMWMQFIALLTKKYIYAKRNWFILLVHITIPLIMILVSLSEILSDEKFFEFQPFKMDIKSYPETITIVEQKFHNDDVLAMQIEDQYRDTIRSFGEQQKFAVITEDFEKYIIKRAKQNLIKLNSEYLIGATIGKTYFKAWFNNQAYHTAPVSLNMLHNAIVKAMLGPSYSINVTNDPLPLSVEYKTKYVSEFSNFGFTFTFNYVFGVTVVGAYFAIFVMKENTIKSKLLQYICGAKPIIFWISTFLFDFFIFYIIITVTIIILASFFHDIFFTFHDIGTLYLIMFLFGLASLPFVYLESLLFRDRTDAYSYIWFINMITGVIWYIIVLIMDVVLHAKTTATTAVYGRPFPYFNLAHTMSALFTRVSLKRMCANVNDCSVEACCDKDIYSWGRTGVNSGLVALFFNFIIYSSLLLMIEYKVFNKTYYSIREVIRSRRPLPPIVSSQNIDEDVQIEKEKISSMLTEMIKSNNIVLSKVTKSYNRSAAVNQASISIESCECFGLLGVNGAGKTTVFKMMIGDERMSHGDIFLKGISLKENFTDIYNHIGYCPQYNALLEDFTGHELLRIHSMLRGIHPNEITSICYNLSKALGFSDCIDKRIKTYNNANKRKLSISLAFLGYPSIIFLDEPTSGMDPKSRRDVWNIVCKARDSGKTVVLTSHNMEECEAVCSRLAIMVNGDFMCLGSGQHLKNKFSKGILVNIKVKSRDTLADYIPADINSSELVSLQNFNSDVVRVKDFVVQHFPTAVIKDEHKDFLTYFIPTGGFKWSNVFGLIENNKTNLNIEDYSISQTTLEQIFLDFAKYQKDIPTPWK